MFGIDWEGDAQDQGGGPARVDGGVGEAGCLGPAGEAHNVMVAGEFCGSEPGEEHEMAGVGERF